MTLTELRYIVAVSQKNHFGKAAQACFVSQPTLSIAIKKLEEELAEAGPLDPLEELLGDDLVGIDVGPIHRNDNHFHPNRTFHFCQ